MMEHEMNSWTIPEHVQFLLGLARKDPIAFRLEYEQLVEDARAFLIVEATVRREIYDRWELKPTSQKQMDLPLGYLEKDPDKSIFLQMMEFMQQSDGLLKFWYQRFGELFACGPRNG